MDAKKLPGWNPGQLINTSSIICEGSHLHRMIPIKSRQDSAATREAYRAGWKRWLGAPQDFLVDAARWNVEPDMIKSCERDGTFVGQIPALCRVCANEPDRMGRMLRLSVRG